MKHGTQRWRFSPTAAVTQTIETNGPTARKIMHHWWFLILLTFALVLPAMARPAAKKKANAAEPNATRRVATQKFSGLKLKGQLKKPDLSYIYKRKGLRADQVVDVPEDFNQETIDSSLSF